MNPGGPNVLLLCASESYAALEKRALRDCGIRNLRLMTSGAQAARLLAGLEEDPSGFAPDIVICSQQLADMDGEQFCAIIRLHPRLLALPILLILPSDSEAEQLRTLGCGASGLLGRPYTVDELQAQIDALSSARLRLEELEKGARHADTRAFDEALATYGNLLKTTRQPEDFFRVGMRCLEESKWNNAINAFQRAMRSAQIKGEAELGMACAWRGKGDQARFHAWLSRAAETFVQARRWHRARVAFARLLEDEPHARNPFLKHARELIRQGQVDQAAQTLAEGASVCPPDQLRDRLVQTCLAADDPAAMLKTLHKGLEQAMGSRASDFADDVRASLELVEQEQREQRRQAALARQRDMSRRLAQARMAEAAHAQGGEGQAQTPEAEPAPTLAGVQAASPASGTNAPARPPGPVAQNAAPASASAGSERQPLAGVQAAGVRRASLPRLEEEGLAQLKSEAQHHLPAAGDADADEEADQAPRRGKSKADLSESEATSGLFAGLPRLNEFLSVIKLTWQLMRRQK